ncbi:uncharacterized protein J5F26_011857 isoform 2-T2 [Ciconia maguari]
MSTAKPKCIKFYEEEKFLILEEFSLRKDVLIPKSGRCKNTLPRQRAWEEIAAAVNSLRPLVWRMPDEIHKKWHNMVIDVCRELAVEKHPLLRQRPQEKLFPASLPSSTSLARGRRTRCSQPRPPERGQPVAPGTLEVTLDLLWHGRSSTAAPGQGLLCPAGTPPVPVPAPESLLAAAGREPKSKERLLLAGLQASMEKRLMAPSMAPSLPAAEMLPAAAPGPTLLQGHGAAGMALVLLASSPKHPAPFHIKCSPTPALVWLRLGAVASPAMWSRGTSSPGPEETGEVPALLPDSALLPSTQ